MIQQKPWDEMVVADTIKVYNEKGPRQSAKLYLFGMRVIMIIVPGGKQSQILRWPRTKSYLVCYALINIYYSLQN